MFRSWKNIAAGIALVTALAVPAAVVAQGLPTLTLNAKDGAFSGTWIYRSFNISGKPGETLAKLALGVNELTLTEQGGRVSGKRTGQGVNYDLTGNSFYAPKQGATIRLHGTATIGGKSYNYDYFGYLMPAWNVGGGQPAAVAEVEQLLAERRQAGDGAPRHEAQIDVVLVVPGDGDVGFDRFGG